MFPVINSFFTELYNSNGLVNSFTITTVLLSTIVLICYVVVFLEKD